MESAGILVGSTFMKNGVGQNDVGQSQSVGLLSCSLNPPPGCFNKCFEVFIHFRLLKMLSRLDLYTSVLWEDGRS